MCKVMIFGTNHYNTSGLVRSLGEKGIKSFLFLVGTDKAQCSIRFSRYVKKIHYLKAMSDVEDVLRLHYWNELEKPVCLFGSDAWIGFFDAHYDEFKDKFALPSAKGGQGAINAFLDKINTFPIAQRSGFDLIKTWRLKGGADIPDDLVFPCLTKGNNSTKSEKSDMGVFICREGLEGSLREGVEYLVQEYIEKDYELNMIGLAYNHGQDVYMPMVIRKIRDEMQRASCYFRLDDIREYPNINIACVRKMVAEMGYEGLFSIEVLCKGDKCYFLEINLRNDACGYAYTRAGINYPYLWVKYNRGKLTPKYLDDIKYKSPFFALSFSDVSNLLEGKVPLFKWIKQFVTADAYMQFSARDMLPFLHVVYKHTVALLLGRK